MTDHTPDDRELLDRVQAFIDRKYVARSDERQRSMGLAYVEAERQDLAKEITSFIRSAALPKQVEPSREEWLTRDAILKLAKECGGQMFGPVTWNISFTEQAWDKFTARIATKPADDGVRIPYDADARLGYVWLIWGVTADRIDLIAIATTEEACGRYLEAGKQMNRYRAVKEEQAFVDHLYGGGLLKAITSARLPTKVPSQ